MPEQPQSGSTQMPLQELAQVLQQRALGQQASGSTTTGPAMPSGPRLYQPLPMPQNQPVNPGPYKSREEAKNASMQNLTNTIQTSVVQMANAIRERKNKQMQQTFSTFASAQQGINQAKEMQQNAQAVLKQDPNNEQAKQMLEQSQQMIQQNGNIMGTLLQDKKNHKILEKAFGVDDKNVGTPERQAAIQAMQKLNPGMSSQTASFMSQIPQTAQVSPLTQLQGQMVQMGVTPKAATGSAMLTAAGKADATAEKSREFDIKNVSDNNRNDVQAMAHGLKPNPDGQGYVPMTPEDLKKYPLLQSKMDMDKSTQELKAAQTDLADAKAKGEPQRIAQAQQRISQAGQNLQIKQAELELKMQSQSRLERAENFKEGQTADGKPLPGMAALTGPSQNVIVNTQPVLDQVSDLMGKLKDYKDVNTPGYFAADRTAYAMGMKSNVTGEMASQIANLELQKVVAAAAALKGSSRALPALKIAMEHTPNVWTDSPALIYEKLNTIQGRLADVVNDAYTYGRKGGYTPAPNTTGGSAGRPAAANAPTAKPTSAAPKSGGDPMGLF
jgi:hypothetical protein